MNENPGTPQAPKEYTAPELVEYGEVATTTTGTRDPSDIFTD